MSQGQMAEKIFKIISYDPWISAAEISTKTGISSHKVAGVIKSGLLGKQVERKRISRRYFYRRLQKIETM